MKEICKKNKSKAPWDYFSVLTELETMKENIKVVFFIDEYETPIVTLFGKPKKWNQLDDAYNVLFQNLKSFQSAPFFEKAIITGVLSLRNLSIFSRLNSFQDLILIKIMQQPLWIWLFFPKFQRELCDFTNLFNTTYLQFGQVKGKTLKFWKIKKWKINFSWKILKKKKFESASSKD